MVEESVPQEPGAAPEAPEGPKEAAVESESKKSARARWPALESNPETFTDFIHKLGAPAGVAIHDVFGFDPELLMMLPQPVYAMIFLFPPKPALKAEREERTEADDTPQPDDEPFFLWQTKALGNACGTIAAIHSLINNRASVPFEDSSILGQFVEATQPLAPGARGTLMETFEPMRKQQQKAASGGSNQTAMTEGKVDYHFVAFVEKGAKIWELDGCKRKPKSYESIAGIPFAERVGQIIQQEFMAKMPEEQNFATLALAPAGEF